MVNGGNKPEGVKAGWAYLPTDNKPQRSKKAKNKQEPQNRLLFTVYRLPLYKIWRTKH